MLTAALLFPKILAKKNEAYVSIKWFWLAFLSPKHFSGPTFTQKKKLSSYEAGCLKQALMSFFGPQKFLGAHF